MLNMRSKTTISFNIFFGFIITVVISDALFDSSANNPSQFLLTPSISFLSSTPSSNVGGTLQSQIPTYNSSTVSSSSQSSTANFATGSSEPEPTYINKASEYSTINEDTQSLASQSTIKNLARGYLASQSAATNSFTGTSASHSATTNSATGSSALESAASNLATGFSASQSATTNSIIGSSTTSQSAAINSLRGSSTSLFTNNGLATQLQTSVAAVNNVPYPVIPVTRANNIYNSVVKVAADSIVQQFSSSISQSLVSLEVLESFSVFEMENSHDIFYNYGKNLLTSAGIQDPNLSEVVSNTVKSLGVLSSPVYFTATSNTLAKFLFSKGVLTDQTAASLSQKFLNLVDSHAKNNGVNSSESLIISVADGLFELVYSLGLLNTNEDFEQLFHLFAEELKSG